MKKRLLLSLLYTSLLVFSLISFASALTFSEWWGKITGFVAGDAASPVILTVSEGKVATTNVVGKAFNINASFGKDATKVRLIVNNKWAGDFDVGNSFITNNVNITVTSIVIKLSGVKYVTLKLFEIPVSIKLVAPKTGVTTNVTVPIGFKPVNFVGASHIIKVNSII